MGKKKATKKAAKPDIATDDGSVGSNTVSESKSPEPSVVENSSPVIAADQESTEAPQKGDDKPPSEEILVTKEAEIVAEKAVVEAVAQEAMANLNISEKQAHEEGGTEETASSGTTANETDSDDLGSGKPSPVNESLESLKSQLEQTEAERDEIQEEYDSLLEKVGLIKQKLGDRFKVLEAEAEQAKAETASSQRKAKQVKSKLEKEIAELKDQLRKAQETSKSASKDAENELRRTKDELDRLKRDSGASQDKLRSELNVLQASQTALQREADVAKKEAAVAKRESDAMKSQLVSQKIMFDQEVLNERLAKETFEAEAAELSVSLTNTENVAYESSQATEAQAREIRRLKEEIAQLKEASERASSEAEIQFNTTNRELEKHQREVAVLRPQVADLASSAKEAAELKTKIETDRRDNQLLIGKLRHEAVILNDHLTQALRLIRKDSEGSTVDKELVSNLLVQYTSFPRQDTKKYEILQLMANILDWDDVRRQQAGLMKPDDTELADLPPTQMVGFVGKLAEYLENRRQK